MSDPKEKLIVLNEKNYFIHSWINPIILLEEMINYNLQIPKKIIALGGISFAFVFFENQNFIHNFWLAFAMVLFLGPIIQFLLFAVISKLLFVSGNFLKGNSSQSTISNMLLLINISLTSLLPLWILKMLFLREAVFNHSKLYLMNSSLSLINSLYTIIWIFLSIWLFINFTKLLAHIQQWHIYKAFLVIISLLLLISMPFILFSIFK